MTIGFIKSQSQPRVPIRNEQGQKVGYIASQNGRQVIQSAEGRTVAVVLRWKRDNPPVRAGACGGSFAPRDY